MSRHHSHYFRGMSKITAISPKNKGPRRVVDRTTSAHQGVHLGKLLVLASIEMHTETFGNSR